MEVKWNYSILGSVHQHKGVKILIPFILKSIVKFSWTLQNRYYSLSNHFSRNLCCFRLSLMPSYMFLGNFHQILQSFGVSLGFHVDVQNFTTIFKVLYWKLKFHIGIQSLVQATLIYVTTQHNFQKYRNIRKSLYLPFNF